MDLKICLVMIAKFYTNRFKLVKYNDENENIVKRENALFELTVLSWTLEWYSCISTLRDSTF